MYDRIKQSLQNVWANFKWKTDTWRYFDRESKHMQTNHFLIIFHILTY